MDKHYKINTVVEGEEIWYWYAWYDAIKLIEKNDGMHNEVAIHANNKKPVHYTYQISDML